MTYNIDLVLKELFGLQRLGIKVGLEHTEELLDNIGNPHSYLKFIHIWRRLLKIIEFEDNYIIEIEDIHNRN